MTAEQDTEFNDRERRSDAFFSERAKTAFKTARHEIRIELDRLELKLGRLIKDIRKDN